MRHNSTKPLAITAYMGRPKDRGGVGGWIPVHPYIVGALGRELPKRDANMAPWVAMFLTVCYQLRGRSSRPDAGDWFEKTRAEWMETLGASRRTLAFCINTLCYDDTPGSPTQGQPLGATSLALVRQRLGGFRNAGMYLVDDRRTAAWWLNAGAQPALGSGVPELRPGPLMDQLDPGEVGPLMDHQVGPLMDHQVGPLMDHQVGPLMDQPQKNNKGKQQGKTTTTGASADPAAAAVAKLLAVYGLANAERIQALAARLASRPDAAQQIYLHGELGLIQAGQRAGTPRAISSVPGWIYTLVAGVDDAAPALAWDDVPAALDDAAAAGQTSRRQATDYDARDAQARRRDALVSLAGPTADPTPAPDKIGDNDLVSFNGELITQDEYRRIREERRARRANK